MVHSTQDLSPSFMSHCQIMREKMDFLVGSFANKGIEVSKKHIEICVRSSYTENFGLRELELIIDESILRGPLAKIEKCDHFIQKGDKFLPCQCESKRCGGIQMSHLDIPADQIIFPPVTLIDIQDAAGSVKAANDQEMINNNNRFAAGETVIENINENETEQKVGRVKSNGLGACLLILLILVLSVSIIIFAELL